MTAADSIVALSSGRLPAGVAVVRLSGEKVRFALETTCGWVPPARHAVLAELRSADGALLDQGIVLFFPAPHSFTGEDVAEFHLHGGRAVVSSVLEHLAGIPGIRHAEAGEFTRRAFLNGRLDLLEAEALADLINADTEAQRRLALHNKEGAQSALYGSWRQRLIRARALIEAELDFSDEADVPGSVSEFVWDDVARLAAEIRANVARYRTAEIIRDGYDVVIVGAPNAGKSSLLNALAEREAAIVSDEPGTTRDLVELQLDLDGFKVRLTDTAGIRVGAGKVEAIGIGRALERARRADMVLQLESLVEDVPAGLAMGRDVVRIGTKADLANDRLRESRKDGCGFIVSSFTGEGIGGLMQFLSTRAAAAVGSAGEVLPSRMRHVALLREAAAALDMALASRAGLEMRAEDLRHAADRLGRISGAVDVEDLLDVVFSQFCIGK